MVSLRFVVFVTCHTSPAHCPPPRSVHRATPREKATTRRSGRAQRTERTRPVYVRDAVGPMNGIPKVIRALRNTASAPADGRARQSCAVPFGNGSTRQVGFVVSVRLSHNQIR